MPKIEHKTEGSKPLSLQARFVQRLLDSFLACNSQMAVRKAVDHNIHSQRRWDKFWLYSYLGHLQMSLNLEQYGLKYATLLAQANSKDVQVK